MTTTTIFTLLALCAGACIAMQASINTRLRINLQSAQFAALVSVCGNLLIISSYLLITRPSLPSMETVRQTQWWNWLGGFCGAGVLLAGVFLTQHLGAATFIAFVVGGQLLTSLLLDHFAMLGLPQHSITPGRFLGAVLVIVGMLAIKYL